jgi:hypothetical protein
MLDGMVWRIFNNKKKLRIKKNQTIVCFLGLCKSNVWVLNRHFTFKDK